MAAVIVYKWDIGELPIFSAVNLIIPPLLFAGASTVILQVAFFIRQHRNGYTLVDRSAALAAGTGCVQTAVTATLWTALSSMDLQPWTGGAAMIWWVLASIVTPALSPIWLLRRARPNPATGLS